ncbi:oxidoreductase [Actinomycetota bacterium]|nr:oxidoreductase [Actinomycetota bacterium]
MTKSRVPIVIFGLLFVAGLVAWIFQLVNGLAVTGMNNGSSWGLYITCFMFFVGLSAGGLIVASSASVFGVKEYKKVAKPAVLLSTVCIIAAAAFILIDLGGIQRVFNLIIHPNISSPLMWDVIVITCYLVINIIYLMLMKKGDADASEAAQSEAAQKNQRALNITSRFALPVAILVHSVTAWIFGLEIAKAGWYTALMAPMFVSSALDSGLALLVVVLVILNKTGAFKTEGKLISSLAGLLVVCIAVDGFMVFCEVLTMGYPAGGQELIVLNQMLTGATAPLFWIEVLLGVVLPFIVLVFAKNRENTALVTVASVCVVVGVLCKRAWLLLTSFIDFNVAGAPGVTYGRGALEGTDIWSLVGSYAPTAIELIVSVGVVSLAVLLFVILAPKVFGQPAQQADDAKSAVEETKAAKLETAEAA